jgi:hypothetical protein
MRVVQIPTIIAAGTVMNTTLYSIALGVPQMFGAAIQIEFTGTPTGTFQLEASSDPWVANPTTGQTPTNWTVVADSQFTVTAAGNVMWNVSDIQYNYVRVQYLDSSGGTSTATITNATANLKGI